MIVCRLGATIAVGRPSRARVGLTYLISRKLSVRSRDLSIRPHEASHTASSHLYVPTLFTVHSSPNKEAAVAPITAFILILMVSG
jgi:hypothetical protein